jgi:hypothetical protein
MEKVKNPLISSVIHHHLDTLEPDTDQLFIQLSYYIESQLPYMSERTIEGVQANVWAVRQYEGFPGEGHNFSFTVAELAMHQSCLELMSDYSGFQSAGDLMDLPISSAKCRFLEWATASHKSRYLPTTLVQ